MYIVHMPSLDMRRKHALGDHSPAIYHSYDYSPDKKKRQHFTRATTCSTEDTNVESVQMLKKLQVAKTAFSPWNTWNADCQLTAVRAS